MNRKKTGSVRKIVRGIGVVKGVWRLPVAELRRHALRLLTERKDWLTPMSSGLLLEFMLEDDGYHEFICQDCGRVLPVLTCTNGRCELCCSRLCDEGRDGA